MVGAGVCPSRGARSVDVFVGLAGLGWEVHTQQGKGKRDWRQFSKNKELKSPACAPLLTPSSHRPKESGFPERARRERARTSYKDSEYL